MFFVHDNRDDRAVCLVFRHGRDATKTEAMAAAIRDALNAAVSRPQKAPASGETGADGER